MDQDTDLKIIRAILEQDNRVIQMVYNECYPMVERMIINSGGDREQAKDVFQEAWIIIYRKVKYFSCIFLYFIKDNKISKLRVLISVPFLIVC
jgi:hypothetical protein